MQSVPQLGHRGFTCIGGNGPGVVVANGDRLFATRVQRIRQRGHGLVMRKLARRRCPPSERNLTSQSNL